MAPEFHEELLGGAALRFDTVDRVLASMVEAALGQLFACEVHADLCITRHWMHRFRIGAEAAFVASAGVGQCGRDARHFSTDGPKGVLGCSLQTIRAAPVRTPSPAGHQA